MNADKLNFPRPLALEYLQHIQALADEITAAMDAVGGNALSTFEASVGKQQEICTGLCRLSAQISSEQVFERQDVITTRPTPGSDQDLKSRIALAAESLQALNERYAALLKHSGESVRLFAGLCRSYTGHFEQPAVAAASRPGWSYES